MLALQYSHRLVLKIHSKHLYLCKIPPNFGLKFASKINLPLGRVGVVRESDFSLHSNESLRHAMRETVYSVPGDKSVRVHNNDWSSQGNSSGNSSTVIFVLIFSALCGGSYVNTRLVFVRFVRVGDWGSKMECCECHWLSGWWQSCHWLDKISFSNKW